MHSLIFNGGPTSGNEKINVASMVLGALSTSDILAGSQESNVTHSSLLFTARRHCGYSSQASLDHNCGLSSNVLNNEQKPSFRRSSMNPESQIGQVNSRQVSGCGYRPPRIHTPSARKL